MGALKRLCRDLKTRPRLVLEYGYQEASHVDVYSDTDHAGCIRTRKSTSGGCMMVGHHVIKTWSATQATISLSSGEPSTTEWCAPRGLHLDTGRCLPTWA